MSVEDVQLDGGKENPYIFNRKDFPFRGGGDQVITSKLTSKAQTTIPQPIRTALHLKEGDEIAYAIEGERVSCLARRSGRRTTPSRPSASGRQRRIERPMAGFKVWDVVAVPFPDPDRPARERRPALVIGAEVIQEGHGLLWVLMITSAANWGWPGDAAVSDLRRAGLPALSVIRTAKIATIEGRRPSVSFDSRGRPRESRRPGLRDPGRGFRSLSAERREGVGLVSEDDLLPLSGLQHLLFCERQFALIHVEGLWEENRYTAEGRALHERVDAEHHESRRLFKQEYGMAVRSLEAGIIGKCDLAEPPPRAGRQGREGRAGGVQARTRQG